MVTEAFAQAMVTLAEAYNAQLSKERIQIYAVGVADLTPEQLQAAFGRAVRECRYFPTVAELRTLALGSPDDEALVQWSGLCRAAESVGAYQDLYVADHATADAVRAVFGGWGTFCEQCADGPALAQRRQEFLAAYRHARRQVALLQAAPEPERLAGVLGGAASGSSCVGVLTASGTVQPVLRLHAGTQRQLAEGTE